MFIKNEHKVFIHVEAFDNIVTISEHLEKREMRNQSDRLTDRLYKFSEIQYAHNEQQFES